MKLLSDKLGTKSQVIVMTLVVLSIFVGLSCVAAADVDANGAQVNDTSLIHPAHNDIVKMAVRFNAGTGYHWEVAPETNGVTLMTKNIVLDHPNTTGSSGTVFYSFLKQNKHCYVKLVLVSPTGEIVKVVEKRG